MSCLNVVRSAYLYDYDWVSGDTFLQTISVKDANGVAVDITGWTFFLTIKAAFSDADAQAVISKTVTAHTSPTGGLTQFNVPESETAPLDGDYVYDMQYKKADGTVRTFMRGEITFQSQVTRRTS